MVVVWVLPVCLSSVRVWVSLPVSGLVDIGEMVGLLMTVADVAVLGVLVAATVRVVVFVVTVLAVVIVMSVVCCVRATAFFEPIRSGCLLGTARRCDSSLVDVGQVMAR